MATTTWLAVSPTKQTPVPVTAGREQSGTESFIDGWLNRSLLLTV